MNLSLITQALKTSGQSQSKGAAPQNTHGQASINRSAVSAIEALPPGTSVKATVIDSANITQDIRQKLIHAQLSQSNTQAFKPSPLPKSLGHMELKQQLSALPIETAKLLADPSLKMVKLQVAATQNWVFTSQSMQIGQKIQAIKTSSGQLVLKGMLDLTSNSAQNSISAQAPISSKLGALSSHSVNGDTAHTVKANTQQLQAALSDLRSLIPSLKSADDNLGHLTQLKKDIGTWLQSTQSATHLKSQNNAHELRPFLAKSIKSLTQNTPSISHSVSPQLIQNAFNNNGMMLENQLFKASQLLSPSSNNATNINDKTAFIAQADQKALSLIMTQYLSAYNPQSTTALINDKVLQHLFKFLGLPQPNIETLKKEGSAIKLLQQLNQFTHDNLNRIRFNQISQILKHVEASTEGVRQNTLSLEVPLRYNTTFIPLYVELFHKDYIEDEHPDNTYASNEEKHNTQSQWEVFLTLELKQIGKLSVCIKTLGESKHAPSIDTQLWIDNTDAYTLFNTHLTDLNTALEKDGFKKNTLTCVNQPPPPSKKQHIAANLIDITT